MSRISHYIFIVYLLLPHYCGQLENHLIVFFIFQLDFLSVVVVPVVIAVVIVAVIVYLFIGPMDFFQINNAKFTHQMQMHHSFQESLILRYLQSVRQTKSRIIFCGGTI